MEEAGRRDPHAVAMVEAALILEAGAGQRFDRLVVVTCRPEQRAQRWAERLKVDLETARRLMEEALSIAREAEAKSEMGAALHNL